MFSFKIVVDSSADLINFRTNIPFKSVPLRIISGEKEFVDNQNLDIKGMVEYLEYCKCKTSTACPSVQNFLDAFYGSKNIICVTITGTLSGSYNSACIARDEYMKEHPDSNIFVINSLSAGPELKLIVEKALELNSKRIEFQQMCDELKKYINTTGLVFSLECLNNLARNGRVNPVVAKAAGLLGIRIVGKASEIGDLKPLDKPRGEERAYKKLYERMVSEGYHGGKVRIDHCYNEKGAVTLKKLILKEHKDADIKIDITYGLCCFYAENGGMLVGFEK